MSKKLIIVFSLITMLALMTTVTVLANEVITKSTSNLNGYYNLVDFQRESGQEITGFDEAPMLKERIQSGNLPTVEERLPENPLVQIPWLEIGSYGGILKWSNYMPRHDANLRELNNGRLLNRPPSATDYHYSGLFGPTQPGVFSEWEKGPEGKVYTFKIREGLKWSDGAPVTTEDVRYCIEDVYFNEEINPVLPQWLRWGGGKTKLEIVDKYTFKLVFSEPYGAFIEHQVRAAQDNSPWTKFIRPKHAMKKYHKEYVDLEKLLPLMKEQGYETKEDWGTYYSDIQLAGSIVQEIFSHPYAIELPTLNPYIVKEVKESGDVIFERNPYFYMIDSEGNQLPYIDKMHRKYVSNKEMINMDILQGNTDMQTYFITFENYPLYKRNEEKGGYKVLPINAWQNHLLIYWFNLAVDDEIFPTEVIQDVRFRQALSLALDRKQIKESIFLGFGEPAQYTTRKTAPYYEEGMAEAYAEYDPEKAKSLLDEMGLEDTDGDGWRDWQGEKLEFPLTYYEVTPVATPGAEAAKRYWEDVGISVIIKQLDVGLWWERRAANQILSATWWGSGTQSYTNWFLGLSVTNPTWRQWYNSDGEEGTEPPAWVKEVWEAQEVLIRTSSDEERIEAARKIWRTQKEKLYILGTVANPKIPFIINENLGNIEVDEVREYTNLTILEGQTQWYFKE